MQSWCRSLEILAWQHNVLCIDLEDSPPHVTALGEGGGLDDFRGHPSVGSCGAHLGGLVPLSGQAEISDL